MQHKNPQLVPWYTVHFRHVRHCLRAASGKRRRSGGGTGGGRARHLCRCHYALAVITAFDLSGRCKLCSIYPAAQL